MPANEIQQPHLAKFHQKVYRVMLEAEENNQPLKRAEAELRVWKELEGTFLQIGLPTKAVLGEQ
jgi:hypothetical protein